MPALIKKPKDAKTDLPLLGHYRHVDFQGADLAGYEFKGIDFSYANFKGSNLSDCKFNECVLFHTNFKGSEMNGGTNLTHVGMRSPIDAGAHFNDEQKQLLGLKENERIR